MAWFGIPNVGNAHFIHPNKGITICDVQFAKDMRLIARPKRKCPICIERRKAR